MDGQNVSIAFVRDTLKVPHTKKGIKRPTGKIQTHIYPAIFLQLKGKHLKIGLVLFATKVITFPLQFTFTGNELNQ